MAKSKKKPVAKKPVKKAVKKTAKKAAPKAVKKAVAKKAAVKKKAAPKKVVAKKTVSKKTKPAAKAAKPTTAKSTSAFKLPVLKTAPVKVENLSDFVTPLDDRVMVQLSGSDRMTAGGLYIPDTAGDVSGNMQGFVVSVGRGHRNKKGHVRPMDLKVGDKILFAQHTGSKIKILDKDFLILRESDVLGVVG